MNSVKIFALAIGSGEDNNRNRKRSLLFDCKVSMEGVRNNWE